MSRDLTPSRRVQEGTPVEEPLPSKDNQHGPVDRETIIRDLLALGIIELAQIPKQLDPETEGIFTEVLRRKMDGKP